ncbi:MAG: hypothetical protein JSV91_09070 [Phycisphaerales bacterium]|nr:MAG: hypothetical protein JSV91_09070 [Phycisphaerales bacterium]
MSIILAGLILLGFRQLTISREQAAIRELQALNEEMSRRLAARDAMIDRLSRSHRLAHVHVTGQNWDENGRVTDTNVRLIELDDEGRELGRQSFTLPGDVLFIDAWSAKFSKDDVAHGHPLRGKAIVLLRRVYSELMRPADGIPLDTPGAIPPGYAAEETGRYEQQVWEHFWQIASDAELAGSMGVRVAQGEAVYKPVRAGQVFELTVDAAGGMNLRPLAESATDEGLLSRAGHE